MPIPESPSSEDWDSSDSSQVTSPVVVGSNAHSDFSIKDLALTTEYHAELKHYLTSFLEKESIQGPAPKRVASRHKLSKLNHAQYLELARDVYDEMVRRTKHEMEVPFLPVNDQFHPRRNQARQKLATLPEHRFMDLSSDVYHELSRRFPHTGKSKQINDALPPLPPKDDFYAGQPPVHGEWSPDQVVPAKDTIQIDQHYHAYSPLPPEPGSEQHQHHTQQNSHQWADSLDNLIADIDSMVKPYSQNKDELSRQKRNSQLELIQKQHDKEVEELKKRIHELEQVTLESKVDADMRKRYDELDKEHQQLLQDQKQQQESVRKVKKEVRELLSQLDDLSAKYEQMAQEKTRALGLVEQLKGDLTTLQAKHNTLQKHVAAKDARPVSNARMSTMSMPWDDGALKPSVHGIISYKTILQYQTAADEFVKSVRSPERTNVLSSMKTIVVLCKQVAQQVNDSDIGHAERNFVDDDEDEDDTATVSSTRSDKDNDDDDDVSTRKVLRRFRLVRSQYATNLYQLTLACQSYVYGSGLYPLRLLDASLGHLTSAIIELVQLLGVYD
ncbi:hypothetical protein BC940DRAFT_366491 [Gongronella butleri]|nr:hypothetical protein BC940DRAFT_366491 [Gongronella butleri]